MGGCTSSKYAADEAEKKPQLDGIKKEKSSSFLMRMKAGKKDKSNGKLSAETAAVAGAADKSECEKQQHANANEDIEFIDQSGATGAAAGEGEEDAKKEVTTYQTTVVKHTQKEGDELLTHLREEAFRTLQNALKQQQQQQTDVTRSTSATVTSATSTSSSSSSSNDEDLLKQIKEQAVTAVGRTRATDIEHIVDSGAALIVDCKAKSMAHLQTLLEQANVGDEELVRKIINATTGFLTAKGTEAGALLSNILANSSATGIQGSLSETERTTVKVTRTVTEQVMSGGQLKEITKVITSNEPIFPGQNIQDIIRNMTASAGTKETQGTNSVTSSTHVNEKHELVTEEQQQELVDKAEKVVTKVVNSAVQRVLDEGEQQQQKDQKGQKENNAGDADFQVVSDVTTVTIGPVNASNGYHETTENVKIEEQSSVKVSTTKLLLNGTTNDQQLDHVQTEFYKNGKHEAEEALKKLITSETDQEQEIENSPSQS